MSRRRKRLRRGHGLSGLVSALVVFVSAAAVDAGVKLVVGPDGRKSVVQDGRTSPQLAAHTPGLAASPPSIESLISRYSRDNRLEERLVRAVIQVESAYDQMALSSKGAMGLMQLMPETARELAVDNPWDAEQNVRGGTTYLARMLAAFDGELEVALAAYNAGPNAVRRYGGIPPYPETRRYVEKVMRLYRGDAAFSLAGSRRSDRGQKTYLFRDAQGRLRMSTTPPTGG